MRDILFAAIVSAVTSLACNRTESAVGAAASVDADSSDSPAVVGEAKMLTVPLRVHLLQSKVEPLNATVDKATVRAWVEETNLVWKEARIEFDLTGIDKVKAQNESDYRAYLDKGRKSGGKEKRKRNKDLGGAEKEEKRTLVASVVPHGNLPSDGVDVFVLERMLGAGGVFKCQFGFVLFGQNSPNGKPNHAKVLAHELGHALGLKHTKCAPDANLMMEPCKDRVPDASSLSDEQIEIAREIAASGKKRVCGPGGEDVED